MLTLLVAAGFWYLLKAQNRNINELSIETKNYQKKVELREKDNIAKNAEKGESLELLKLEKDILSIKKDEVNAKNALYMNIVQVLGLLTVTSYLTWRNLRATEEKLVTERFSKAVEHLGSEESQIIMGGVYSLERISQDSHKDYWVIMEILASFVRRKSPAQVDGTLTLERKEIQQIQQILTVIGRRDVNNDKEKIDLSFVNFQKINLSTANLTGVNLQASILSNLNLNHAILSDANLNGADLSGANLTGAILIKVNSIIHQETFLSIKFVKANLTEANLSKAILNLANFTHATMDRTILTNTQLREAIMIEAQLVDANLDGADLTKTNLSKANLQGASFKNAILNGANLTDARGLDVEQIRMAKDHKNATFSKTFQDKLNKLPVL
jgi:uncharacterized protein YjbI with pentapeptide repeats